MDMDEHQKLMSAHITQTLIASIEAEIKKEDRLPEEKVFLMLLKRVWQVDWNVTPHYVWARMKERDMSYFFPRMNKYQGEEESESDKQLLDDWMHSGNNSRGENTDSKQRAFGDRGKASIANVSPFSGNNSQEENTDSKQRTDALLDHVKDLQHAAVSQANSAFGRPR